MKTDYKEFSATDFAHDDFFIRWVKGDAANCESFWQSFIKQNPSKAAEIAEAKRIVRLFQFSEKGLSNDEREAMRKRILLSIEKLGSHPLRSEEGGIPTPFRIRNLAFLKAAAIVSIVMICLFAYRLSEHPPEMGSMTPLYRGTLDETLEMRVNPKGQKSVLYLEDGSKVWLNAESTLNYGKDLVTSDCREVYLDGEAFFEVAHDMVKPFVVHTSDLIIHVHGTSFNVKAYSEDGRIETTLVNGKVSINKQGDDASTASVVLNPNERAVFLKENRTIKVEEVLAERTAEWREDRLVFDETPFSEAITQLERWYGVKIYAGRGEDLDCTLTAHVEKESLAQVMDLLAASQKITYLIKGNEVFIKGSLCE